MDIKTLAATELRRTLLNEARDRADAKRGGAKELEAKLEEKFRDKLTAMTEWSEELKKRDAEFHREFLRFRDTVAKAAHGTGFEARPETRFLDGGEEYRIEVYPGCQSAGADVKRELKALADELGVTELLKAAE